MAKAPKMVKGEVIALRAGYAGGQIRAEGERFSYEGPLGSWMKEVGKTDPPLSPPDPVRNEPVKVE